MMSNREDQILEQARQQVADRRTRRRGEFFLQGLLVWWLLVLVAFFLVPWPLSAKVWVAVHGLCAQRPGHMLLFGEQVLPLCARDSGTYLGVLLGTVYLLARGRWRAAGRPLRAFWFVLAAALLFFGVDVVNSVALDWFGWQAYPPHNALRLASGLLLGLVTSVLLLWVVHLAFANRQTERRIVAQWGDLLGLAGVGIGGGLILWSGWPPLYVPATVLSVGGAVLLLWVGNALFFLTRARGRELIADFWEITPFLFWGGIAAVAEMALLAWLRYRVGG
jgi:uncharacterized membrane protein